MRSIQHEPQKMLGFLGRFLGGQLKVYQQRGMGFWNIGFLENRNGISLSPNCLNLLLGNISGSFNPDFQENADFLPSVSCR